MSNVKVVLKVVLCVLISLVGVAWAAPGDSWNLVNDFTIDPAPGYVWEYGFSGTYGTNPWNGRTRVEFGTWTDTRLTTPNVGWTTGNWWESLLKFGDGSGGYTEGTAVTYGDGELGGHGAQWFGFVVPQDGYYRYEVTAYNATEGSDRTQTLTSRARLSGVWTAPNSINFGPDFSPVTYTSSAFACKAGDRLTAIAAGWSHFFGIDVTVWQIAGDCSLTIQANQTFIDTVTPYVGATQSQVAGNPVTITAPRYTDCGGNGVWEFSNWQGTGVTFGNANAVTTTVTVNATNTTGVATAVYVQNTTTTECSMTAWSLVDDFMVPDAFPNANPLRLTNPTKLGKATWSYGTGDSRFAYWFGDGTRGGPLAQQSCLCFYPESGWGWMMPGGQHVLLSKFTSDSDFGDLADDYQIGEVGGHGPWWAQWQHEDGGWFTADYSTFNARYQYEGGISNGRTSDWSLDGGGKRLASWTTRGGIDTRTAPKAGQVVFYTLPGSSLVLGCNGGDFVAADMTISALQTPAQLTIVTDTTPLSSDAISPWIDATRPAPVNVPLPIKAVTPYSDCDNNQGYVFSHWTATNASIANSSAAVTTVTINALATAAQITAHYTDVRVCGDQCHPYPEADLTKDCKVNFEDFSVMAMEWLVDNSPQ